MIGIQITMNGICRVVGFQYMNPKGNLIEDSWWRWDHDPNEMIESGRYFYKYDFDGNLIEKYNSHGEKEYVYTYDAYGNLLRQFGMKISVMHQ